MFRSLVNKIYYKYGCGCIIEDITDIFIVTIIFGFTIIGIIAIIDELIIARKIQMNTIAKFECTDVLNSGEGLEVTLVPVVDGSAENEEFFKYTPYGSITLGIVNPNVNFELGEEYYVEFKKHVKV